MEFIIRSPPSMHNFALNIIVRNMETLLLNIDDNNINHSSVRIVLTLFIHYVSPCHFELQNYIKLYKSNHWIV